MKIMVAFLGNKNKKQKRNIDVSRYISNLNKVTSKQKNKKEFLKNDIQKPNINSLKENIINNFTNNRLKLDKNKIKNDVLDVLDMKSKKSDFESADMLNNVSNFKLTKMVILSIFVIPLLFFVISNSKVEKFIFNLATNFKEETNKDIKLADLIATYGLYNSNNYIIKTKEEVKQVEVAEENGSNSDEEIIDKEAQIEDVQTFFGNQKVNVEITENSQNIQRITVGTSKILNYSSKREIDFANLLSSNITLTKKSDKILLYNSHTSESYTNSELYKFEYTGTMRTTDAEYNMLAIAKKLNENLKFKGFESVHNTTPHDYGTYTSAYAKSRKTVTEALASIPDTGIIIDVHRDAVADLTFAPTVNIKGLQVAQLMFVVGVGSDSVPNENWQENLKLALKLQQIADRIYPGLFRPMIIRNSVYNQDLNKFSLLIEFGATGNTIEQVKLSTRCVANLLNILYKD